MSQRIYQILQELIPELKQQTPVENGDFTDFSAWINQFIELLHYIELKEYYDNGIEENFYFKKFNVNTQQLNNDIDQQLSNLFEQSEEGFEEDSFDQEIDLMEHTETILFDNIKKVADEHQLSLLVVYRENPYWLLVPSQNQQQLEMMVEEFNQAFNDDGDLNMAIY